MAANDSIYGDINNYDWMQSSSSGNDLESPQPKRMADVDTMATHYQYGCDEFESEATQKLQDTPKKEHKSPRKRPEPTEGYIYGFILPFDVDNKDYYVVKIGKTTLGQLGRRLRDHNSEFIKATAQLGTPGIPIFTQPILATTPDEVIINDLVKWNDKTKVFLLSKIKNGLRAAEFGARACIGVAPFNTSPKFKTVFPDSKRVTTTEWVVAKKQVVEDIQVEFWHDKLATFDSADAFLEKLKELNKRKHVELTISLETITTMIYRDKVKVPEYTQESLDPRP